MKLSQYLLPVWATLSQAQQTPSAVPFSTGFNSSFSLSAAQIKAASLSDTIATSINAIINFDRSNLANGGPSQDAFYTLPPAKSALQPGQVLKVQQVTDPTPFGIAPGSSLSRILYTTRDFNGTVVPASAYVLWPYIPRQFRGEPKRKAPAILWAHGTSGYFADSGPSSYRNLYYENVIPLSLVQAGYAVVAPDYAGLGLEKSWDGSTIPHQYFAMSAGGQDTLYAMEAALEAFGKRLSGKFAVAGHSQGGGVAWSAAELLASGNITSGKNEFKQLRKGYVGTISFAPVTSALAGSAFTNIATAIHLSSIFPDFTLEQWLRPLAIARTKLLGAIQGSTTAAQRLFLTETDDALMKPDWYNSSYHARAFEKLGNVGRRPFAGPMLVVQGSEDVFVAPAGTNETAAATCDVQPAGDLEYVLVDNVGHTPIVSAVRLLWMNWLEERFSGEKAAGGCKTTLVTGWLGDGAHFMGSNAYSQWAGAPEYTYQNPGAV
ncbi:hypothetical protein AK830_g2590 [Neonectria ditissima]|uniref:AB hydrolase-1 domain-containing protein n=1 Tax=Neonectria ditissima TaxID=78410 RepID=A0A0P7B2E2_9HYPO|nr:hypothetical protein AK830_g2590 [Neonectria ditissima]